METFQAIDHVNLVTQIILYESLHHSLPFSIKLFNATSWSNLSLYFDLSKGIISSLKWSAETFSPTKKNPDDNEHNTQALWIYWKNTTSEHQEMFLL